MTDKQLLINRYVRARIAMKHAMDNHFDNRDKEHWDTYSRAQVSAIDAVNVARKQLNPIVNRHGELVVKVPGEKFPIVLLAHGRDVHISVTHPIYTLELETLDDD